MGKNAIVPYKSNFRAGEWSPLMEGSIDLAQYPNSCKELTNNIVLIQGGFTRRPGLRYAGIVKDSTKKVRNIPFKFNTEQAYNLEFGDYYVRFYKDRAPIYISGSTPYEIVSPFSENDLFDIQWTQSADVLYLTHPSYYTRKLSRLSDTEWIFTILKGDPPPTYPFDVDLDARIAYSAATGIGITFRASADIWLDADVGRTIVAGVGRGSITALGADTDEVVVDIRDDFNTTKITTGPGTLSTVGTAATASLDHGLAQGDFVRVASGAQEGEIREAVTILTSTTATLDVAFSVDQTTISWEKVVPLQSGAWFIRGAPQTTLDPNIKKPVGATINLVAAADAFRAEDVGKYIRIYDGLIKITVFTNAKTLKGIILKELTGSTTANPAATENWVLEENSWSAVHGYPRACEFIDGRLGLGGTLAQPTTWWLSAVDNFESFATANLPADAVEYTMASREVNLIQWLTAGFIFFIGTDGAIHLGKGKGVDEPLGGDIIPDVKQQTPIGVARIQPLSLLESILFVGVDLKNVYDLAGYSPELDRQVPEPLSWLAEHLFTLPLKQEQIAFQTSPYRSEYFIRSDGKLLCLTYNKKVGMVAWSVIETEGLFESVTSVPLSEGRNRVWCVVRRIIDGVSIVKYEEFFDDDAPEFATRQWKSLQTDCAGVYDGVAKTEITGLGYIEGLTVDVIADGSYKGTKVVSGGIITLDDAASKVEYGLHYASVAITSRPTSDIRIIEGLPGRWSKIVVRFDRTIGARVNGQEVAFDIGNQPLDSAPQIFTGDKKVVDLGWDDPEKRITIRQDQPYPQTVLAVYGTLELGDNI